MNWIEAFTIAATGIFVPEPQTADILFAGDAMMHQAQIEAAHCSDGSYDYSECFTQLQPFIENADYAVVNLETPLGGAPYSGYPCFSAPDSYASALKDAGFDLFLTANNHTLDRRDRGLRRTVTTLDALGVDHIGTYSHDSCRSRIIPLVKDIKGFKIGFLNYTYGTNGITPGPEVIVDYIDTTAIKLDIDATRRGGAELLVVAIHWGDEYHLLPNTSQKRTARFLLDHGVDMVIGSHPHVIQPMELNVSESDSLDRRLIVYSLGNFISNMKTRDTRGGAMVHITLRRDFGGRACIQQASYIPVFTVPPSRGHNFQLVPASRELTGSSYETARRQFLESARSIFNNHNVNVPEEDF